MTLADPIDPKIVLGIFFQLSVRVTVKVLSTDFNQNCSAQRFKYKGLLIQLCSFLFIHSCRVHLCFEYLLARIQ